MRTPAYTRVMERTVIVGEPPLEIARWLDERRRLGHDLFDEVWDGDYHVAPSPHGRHGDVEDQVAALLRERARSVGLWPSGPANIGELGNFRVPDRSYFAERRHLNFHPTAALVVEIVSPRDESYLKLDFYFARGVVEVLIVNPETHAAEWFVRAEQEFVPAEASDLLSLSGAELTAAIDWPA